MKIQVVVQSGMVMNVYLSHFDDTTEGDIVQIIDYDVQEAPRPWEEMLYDEDGREVVVSWEKPMNEEYILQEKK